MNETSSRKGKLFSTIRMRFSLGRFLFVLMAIGVLIGYLLNQAIDLQRNAGFVKSLGGQSASSLYCNSAGMRKPFHQRSVVQKVTDFICFPFSEISNVDLSDSKKMTDHHLELLVMNMPNIKRLDLSNTQISDNGIQDVAKLEKLQFVNFSGTKVTSFGIEYLKTIRPEIEISEDVESRILLEMIQKTLSEDKQHEKNKGQDEKQGQVGRSSLIERRR